MKRLPLLALAVLVLSNALILAGAAWNRGGEPEATLVLSERELRLPWHFVNDNENTGVSLALQWERPDEGRDWFDEGRLRAVGFDTDDLTGSTDNSSRRAFVVLGLDEADWQRRLQEAEAELAAAKASETGEEGAENVRQAEYKRDRMREQSRLRLFEVGADPVQLRTAFPDRSRYLVVPAEITAFWLGGHEPKIVASVTRLLPAAIHVPTRFNAAFGSLPVDDGLGGRQRGSPSLRFEATLNYGRRHEPWISDLRILPD